MISEFQYGVDLEPKIQVLSPDVLQEEVSAWLNQMKISWSIKYGPTKIMFGKESDLMLFKLRWM